MNFVGLWCCKNCWSMTFYRLDGVWTFCCPTNCIKALYSLKHTCIDVTWVSLQYSSLSAVSDASHMSAILLSMFAVQRWCGQGLAVWNCYWYYWRSAAVLPDTKGEMYGSDKQFVSYLLMMTIAFCSSLNFLALYVVVRSVVWNCVITIYFGIVSSRNLVLCCVLTVYGIGLLKLQSRLLHSRPSFLLHGCAHITHMNLLFYHVTVLCFISI